MLNGCRATPQYDNSSIDASIVEKDVPDYKIERRVPEVYEVYVGLLRKL